MESMEVCLSFVKTYCAMGAKWWGVRDREQQGVWGVLLGDIWRKMVVHTYSGTQMNRNDIWREQIWHQVPIWSHVSEHEGDSFLYTVLDGYQGKARSGSNQHDLLRPAQISTRNHVSGTWYFKRSRFRVFRLRWFLKLKTWGLSKLLFQRAFQPGVKRDMISLGQYRRFKALTPFCRIQRFQCFIHSSVVKKR